MSQNVCSICGQYRCNCVANSVKYEEDAPQPSPKETEVHPKPLGGIWHSVAEVIPEMRWFPLILTDGKSVWYQNRTMTPAHWEADKSRERPVTHWMRMPELPSATPSHPGVRVSKVQREEFHEALASRDREISSLYKERDILAAKLDTANKSLSSCSDELRSLRGTDSELRKRLRTLLEHAKSKTACADHYKLLLQDIEKLLATPEAGREGVDDACRKADDSKVTL